MRFEIALLNVGTRALIILAEILSIQVAFLMFRFVITFSTLSLETGVNEKFSIWFVSCS